MLISCRFILQEVNLNDASSLLKVQKRRIYDITNVLEGVGLLHKTFKNKIKWIGRNGAPPEPGTHAALAAKVLSNGRCNNGSEMKRNTLTSELRALEQREKDLDRKMHLAMNHLQQMTEDEQNKRYAFLTYLDIKSIDELSNQTVIAIKAPSETKLEVPDPREKLQMWLKSDKGEIEVYICPEHAPNNGSSVASNSTTSTTGNHTNHNSTNHHSHQSHSTNNSNHNNGSSNHHNASASTTTTTTQQQSNSNRVQTSINHSATCIDSSDQERGESLDSGLDSLHRSHSNTGHHSSSSNALKHAFISEDDDLGLMGARDLQMQTDDQAAINNAQHGKSGNASSGAGTGNASSATGVNNTSSVTNRQQSNCSPAPINDLLFLHLQPPLSEDDYNFALEDSEGIADLFGEMLPTYK